jgi:hypothetical protein
MPDYLHRSVAKAIIVGAVVAAVLDMLEPIVFFGIRGVPPIKMPQAIASGLLGRAAYSGGLSTALLGLALHLFIALVWATLFVLIARLQPILTRQPVVSGLSYGVVIYLVMHHVVLPLSRVVPRSHSKLPVLINDVAAMVFLVGLPISLANRRLAPPPRLSSN